jgi:arylsulfatase A-like enzyme
MRVGGRWWDPAALEIGVLVGGTVGLAEGLRAVATTPGTLLQEVGVVIASVLIPMWFSALVLPPTVQFLRRCVGSSIEETDTTSPSPARYLARATAYGFCAALLGLVIEDAASLLWPHRHLIHAGLAFFGVLLVFFGARRLLTRRPSRARRMYSLTGVSVVLIMGYFLHVSGLSSDLPSNIDTGNQSPISSTVSWGDQTPPNILFVVLDTTRLDRLSLYGYPLQTSPELDRLAAEATVFERAISTAPWTLPSHASMFTGLMPRVHQATEEHRTLRDDFVTFAEILLDHGYETVGFSSNSVVGRSHNLHQGFQHFYEVSGDIWSRAQNPFQELIPVQVTKWVFGGVFWKDKGAERCTLLAERWLDQWQRRSDSRPFLAFVNYVEGHLPYHPPPRWARRFGVDNIRPILEPLVSIRFNHGDVYRLIGYRFLMEQADYDQLGALYDASLAYQDERLGELIDGLRRRGILDETVVIIVSDHGENLGDHGGLLGHALSVHQTLVHVPLVIRYPQLFSPGDRHEGVVSIASLFRTVLDVAGASADRAWTPSVGPLPYGADEGPGYAFSEYAVPVWELYNLAVEARGVDIGPMLVRKRSVQNRDWKVIEPSVGSPVLFHLAEDPDETDPREAIAEPDGLALLSTLASDLGTLPRPELPPVDAAAVLDDETRAALKALGYMQ